jgi:hypothetical protein
MVLLRTLLASLVAYLPMLGLLLVPQLMRSRAGSESLLLIGSTLYLLLIAAALLTTPLLSALAAPSGDSWAPRSACATVRAIRRSRPLAFWQRVGEWGLLFIAGQAAGLLVAYFLPYVEDNPQFGTMGQPRWILQYDNYATQAVVVYLLSCLSFAWLGTRLRALATIVPR